MINVVQRFLSSVKEIFPCVEPVWRKYKFKKIAVKISRTNCLEHVSSRRNAWISFSDRICKILKEYKVELKNNGVDIYYINTVKEEVFNGEKYNNFNIIEVTPLSFPSGISCKTISLGQVNGSKLIVQKTGSFSFSQVANGLVCINFFSHVLIFDKKDRPQQYIYGVFDPRAISDDQIHEIILHGIDFMFNSYPDGKLLIKNRWLMVRDYRKTLLEGMFVGLAASFSVQIIWELCKIIIGKYFQ